MKKKLPFNEDYIWMSYRYCIGRSTIAAYMHAGTIANDVYGKLSDERMIFNANDINNEIYTCLHHHDFIDFGWHANIPKEHFKPLDVVFSILDKEKINTNEKFSQIKNISIDWNHEKMDYDYEVYYYQDNDKHNYNLSLSYLEDLMAWQRLANLFDTRTHKRCRLIDGREIEYYEFWIKYFTLDGFLYKKVKTPIEDYHNFSVVKFIPEESIETIIKKQ